MKNIKEQNNQLKGWEEKNRFDSKLAIFISFVEDEAKRIDEEHRGAHRRDGGRKMQCVLFLQQFLASERNKTIEEVEKMKKLPPLGEKFILNTDTLKIATDAVRFHAHNQAIDEVITILKK